MKPISSRKDISILINKFYAKIRRNELLGPIFNGHIPKEKWPEHLEKLTDFWEMRLFGASGFNGNPSQKHVNVDHNMKHTIAPHHFEQWLQLWFETLDELYEGEVAESAKQMAKQMANGQYRVVLNNRPKEQVYKFNE